MGDVRQVCLQTEEVCVRGHGTDDPDRCCLQLGLHMARTLTALVAVPYLGLLRACLITTFLDTCLVRDLAAS